MAEIKTGIFAKNVQKRLNRAQEKVWAAWFWWSFGWVRVGAGSGRGGRCRPPLICHNKSHILFSDFVWYRLIFWKAWRHHAALWKKRSKNVFIGEKSKLGAADGERSDWLIKAVCTWLFSCVENVFSREELDDVSRDGDVFFFCQKRQLVRACLVLIGSPAAYLCAGTSNDSVLVLKLMASCLSMNLRHSLWKYNLEEFLESHWNN